MDTIQQKEINDFIESFKRYHKNEVINLFLFGHCYWFAAILKERFNGIIYYLPIENHFITKIGDSFYDIRGRLTDFELSPTMYEWEHFKVFEPAETKRIIKYCINKELD